MENELIIRNKFLQYNNTKHFDTIDNTWLLSNNKKSMFDHTETDHTVPSREIMESRERRIKQAQHMMSINPIEVPRVKEDIGKELYLAEPGKLRTYDNFGIGYNHEHIDNSSGYTVPVNSSDDICVEEILVGLGETSDGWYHPSPYHYERPHKRFNDVRVPSQDSEITPPPSPYYPYSAPASYSRPQLVAYSPRNESTLNLVPVHKRRKVSPPRSPEEEPRLVESSDEKENYYDDEVELDSHKRKKKMHRVKRPIESPAGHHGAVEGIVEDVGGICGKTNKPRQRKEYFYSKNSKTIFRWTCCGSQAKDHPEF